MNLEREVHERLQKSFPEGKWEIDFADGKHMSLEITDPSFKGLGLVEQHKLVYSALDDLIREGWLHALRLKTKNINQ